MYITIFLFNIDETFATGYQATNSQPVNHLLFLMRVYD